MSGVNYDECPYAADKDDEDRAENPCYHPMNFEKDCPLDNKKPGKKAPCRLVED